MSHFSVGRGGRRRKANGGIKPMSAITLLDGSLKLRIFYDTDDNEFEDAICLSFHEDCVEDEKVLSADEVNIYLTPQQAALIVLELSRAVEDARQSKAGL